MKYKNLLLMLACLTMLAGPFLTSAFAGPVFKFGPDDKMLLKIDYKGQFQLLARDAGAGPDAGDNTSEFNFRRNRIALMGAYENFSLYVQTEFTEDRNIGPLEVGNGDTSDFQMLDAVLRFKLNNAVRFNLGKFKYNFTRENLEACEAPLTLDRSLLIRSPLVDEGTRDKGVAVWGNLMDNKFQYRVDAMNGRNDSVSSPDSNYRYSARIHVSLLDPEKGYGYKGTYQGKKKVLTIGAAYQVENDVAYADFANQADPIDYKAWTADIFFEYPVAGMGTFTLSGAYADYDLDEAYKGADPDPEAIDLNGEKNGGYVKAAYMLPSMPLQLFARSENWSFARLFNVYDQEVNWYGAGFNYYFRGQNLKFTAEYSVTDFDKEGTVSGVQTEDFGTFVAQLQVVF